MGSGRTFRPMRSRSFPPAAAACRKQLRRLLRIIALPAMVVLLARCTGGDGQREPSSTRKAITTAITGAPDELPSLTNREPPFRYPPELYARRVQGNVTLRLFVDSTGGLVADSTRVEESSGHAALDSAAVKGSHDLRFNPARRRGSAIAVSLLYPVYFRHPEAGPMPGDSILRTRSP